LVIGAGPAGIASAYALKQANIAYVVFDRAQTIASTWDSLYPSLRLNTTRFFSHLPHMRFPWHYGIFPTGRQYHNYLLRFVARHKLNIRLGISVQRVSPEGDKWRVETSHGVYHFRAVICASGIYGSPVMPKIDGMEAFGGRIIHAHDFRHPNQVTGENILVVGNGPSGVDIAVACANTAQSVAIAIRSGVTFKRRYPYGLPQHAWMMMGALLPKMLCQKLMAWVGKADFGDTSHLGLPTPQGRGSITAYQGRELIDAVKRKRVQPVSAPIKFCAKHIELADGRKIVADTVIMATGYEPVLHRYLDIPMQYSEVFFEPSAPCEWQVGPNGQRGFPLLDRSTHPNGREVLGYRGLYIVGVWYKGKGAMYNFWIEAQIATQQIRAYLAQS
jgi:cation diffusion facilitator CzcD-associated flavoprotein CzcO